ncbi:MAG: tRNA (adenosine(37)-N6)-dimethylallyltransferase MiaA [Pseudomonadota bacterium]|nr:tRNA (adenosine(37)-N6)-dimethylallyltransferase MiaA [Pseudomonadota bacterium]
MARGAVFLMGPTGTGKSALAMRLAAELPFEIVSTDSALVYRGMDIGTAKPTPAMRGQVPHHLIDIRDAAVAYSAGEFVVDARAAMEDIWQRGRQPLLVGGTMLYFHALTAGIAALPDADLEVRARLDARAAASGWSSMHAELVRVDAEAAARIHPHDAQRIQRALEVQYLTGQPISVLQRLRRSVLEEVEVVEFALLPGDRTILHAHLASRFAAMLADGFIDEVRSFFERDDLSAEHPSMRAVGYRQIWRHLEGKRSLEEACSETLAATRQLAKRQLTWLRGRPNALPIRAAGADPEAGVLGLLTEERILRWFR